MPHLLKIFTSALAVILSMPMYAQIISEKEAREWCDASVLAPVEGIWEYPEDGTHVLIKADPTDPGCFTITILSTPDCRLDPGDAIGKLRHTVDVRQFRLRQWTRKDKISLTGPLDCVATLSTDGESLRIKTPDVKFKINLNTLLPRFWRLVRLSVDNPAEDLPAGMVKVYPGYDHNGSLRRKIRIL